MPGGSGRTSPLMVTSVGIPASLHRSTASSRSLSDGCGDRPSGTVSSSRSTPSMRRISPSASRPIVSMSEKITTARSGSARAISWPAAACTEITLIPCATTSCISRAIRVRSRATSSRAVVSTAASARDARSRRSASHRLRWNMISPTTAPREWRKKTAMTTSTERSSSSMNEPRSRIEAVSVITTTAAAASIAARRRLEQRVSSGSVHQRRQPRSESRIAEDHDPSGLGCLDPSCDAPTETSVIVTVACPPN